MKHTFQKIIVLVTIFALTVVSCQNDDFNTNKSSQSSDFSLKDGKPFREVTFEEFQNFPTAYEFFLNLKKSNSNSILKSTEKGFDGEDFTFDTDIIRLYEYKDGITEYKTFIFPITRSQPRTYYENLVIWENAYGETTSWIFEYDLDENDLTKLLNDQKVDDLPKKFRIKLLNDPDDTYAIYIHDYGIWLRYDGRCFIYDRNGEIPTDCPEEVANLALTLSDPNNGGNGSGGNGSGGSGGPYFNYIYIPPSLPGGNNGSSGPVGSYYPPAGVGGGPRVPTVVAPFVDLIEGIINNNFTEAEKVYLNSKPNLRDAVKSYLGKGNLINGPGPVDLAVEIVQFAMEGNTNSYDNAVQLLNHLISKSPINQSDSAFVEWALDFLNNNTEVTSSQFKNWFLTEIEGNDLFGYDSAYWDNPNLTFTQQDLPSWEDFEDEYPTGLGADLVNSIGGDVKAAYDQYPSLTFGYCALKVSRGLNYSGVTIPNITTTSGNPGTIKGGDNKYYFVNAKALNKWMRETFGTNPLTTTTPYNANHYHYEGSEGGDKGENFVTLTANKKGIYSMVAIESLHSTWASGHADLINDSECTFGCHFYEAGLNQVPVDYIDIWVLE